MNIDEIKRNAPEGANYYKTVGTKVKYFSVRTRHVYEFICIDKWANNWDWVRLVDYNDTDNLKPL
ncbi:hypothetical protein [Acinetobacter phage BUCT628]|nr:hypothetical protein [Acinetobacter phage BUCT628]